MVLRAYVHEGVCVRLRLIMTLMNRNDNNNNRPTISRKPPTTRQITQIQLQEKTQIQMTTQNYKSDRPYLTIPEYTPVGLTTGTMAMPHGPWVLQPIM